MDNMHTATDTEEAVRRKVYEALLQFKGRKLTAKLEREICDALRRAFSGEDFADSLEVGVTRA